MLTSVKVGYSLRKKNLVVKILKIHQIDSFLNITDASNFNVGRC